MDALDAREVLLQRQHQVFGQHGDAILGTLAVADEDLAALELDVLLVVRADRLRRPLNSDVRRRKSRPAHT